jgi:hypothetical protein
MKTRLKLLFALMAADALFTQRLNAQGTIRFESGINIFVDGVPFIHGDYTLDADRLFTASVWIIELSPSLSVSITRASSMSDPGSKIADLPLWIIIPPDFPDNGGEGFSLTRSLTTAEASDLIAGNWYLDIAEVRTLGLGSVREHIVMVPEPTTIELGGIAGFALWLRWNLKRKRI